MCRYPDKSVVLLFSFLCFFRNFSLFLSSAHADLCLSILHTSGLL